MCLFVTNLTSQLAVTYCINLQKQILVMLKLFDDTIVQIFA